jgi:hypothetical protein
MKWWRPLAIGVAIGVLMAWILLALSGPADARHYRRACPHHVTQGYVARSRYVRCEARRVNPPGTPAFAVGVGNCESGLRPHAINWPYLGAYQHHAGYWDGRFRTFTGSRWEHDGNLRPTPFAFRSNVIVTMRMARAQGWGAWACA